MGFFDAFKKTKKEVSHETMRKIRESGKQGERHFEWDNALSKIKKVHRGRDYDKYVRDSSGRIRREPHEVKRNNSPLSKAQKKTWGLKVDRYVDTPYGIQKITENRAGERLEQNPLTGKWSKKRKRDRSSSMLGASYSERPKHASKKTKNKPLVSLFGSSSSNKRKKSSANNSLWGSSSSGRRKKSSGYDSLFGTGSSSRSRRKSSSYDSLWGVGSSRKRKRSSFW